MILTEAIKEKMDIDNISDRQKNMLLAYIILNYVGWTAQIGVIVTMMIMFVKHNQTISQAKQEEIKTSFLLVFSKLDEISDINDMRVSQHYEKMEKEKEDKKNRIYRQMADEQLMGLISMMNLENFQSVEDASGEDSNNRGSKIRTKITRQTDVSTETISDCE